MFVRNCWYVAANSQELTGNRIVGRKVLDIPLAFGRLANGHVMAAFDRCPHRATPLTAGVVTGDTFQCGYHGARFGEDGRCVSVPGQNYAPASGCSLNVYPAQERYGFVWVWLGEAVPTSIEDDLPAFAVGGDPAWHGANGLFDGLKADYKLVADNLFDITHAEFVHPESFGGPETRLYRTMEAGDEYCDGKMTYQMEERRITVRMRAKDLGEDCGPFFRWMVATGTGADEFTGPIDQELEIAWVAPSFVSFRGTSSRGGSAARFSVLILHAVTPESASGCHYFYRVLRDFAPGEAITEALIGNVGRIFQQDRKIIELQQSRIGADDLFAQSPVSFAGDIVQVRARKIIRDLVAAEAGSAV